MRRGGREVKDFSEIVRSMEACDVCRLALHDGEYPYILPLNFGMETDRENVTLYFHGAKSGKKHELMEKTAGRALRWTAPTVWSWNTARMGVPVRWSTRAS